MAESGKPARANNYGVASIVPPDNPSKVVHMMDVEALAAKVAADGAASLCRCFKSSTFPYCDGSHVQHNAETGDNAGPLVVKAGLPAEKRGLDFTTQLSEEERTKAVAGPRANNYGVKSNMPPDNPSKVVDMIDIEDVKEGVAAGGGVMFCRCFNSKKFPLCDGSHGDHNAACGDNAGPVVVKNLGGTALPAAAKPAGLREISYEEVAKHATPEDAWVIVGDLVYDLTTFASNHPGGKALVLQYAGRDSTKEFLDAHPKSIVKTTLPDGGVKELLGTIDPATIPEEATLPIASVGDPPAPAPLAAGELDLPPIENCINLFDFESVAKKKMALTNRKKGWDYYSSGADDEVTLRENHSAFQRIFLKPRVLVNVKNIDTSTTVLGHDSSFPVYLSAVALQKLGHPEGELTWIRAAKRAGILTMLPTLASCGLDEMASECHRIGQTAFFQLYVNSNRTVCEEIVRAAEAAGCKALFITVDAPQLGRRERDMRNKASTASQSTNAQKKAGDSIKKDQGTSAALTSFIDPSLCWEDIAWFQSITTMDIMLKGIQTAEDCVLAKQAGVKGVVLSNHGGRQLDFARSGIEVLPEAMAALKEDFTAEELEDFHVFVDGGVRRGTDILKALALGARAVGIGKPVAYAMSAYGEDGIAAMLDGLRGEFENAMRLMGVTSLDQLKPRMVDTTALSSHIISGYDHYAMDTYVPLDTVMVRHDSNRATAVAGGGDTAALQAELASAKARIAELEGQLLSAAPPKANNYGVDSNMPPDNPSKVVSMLSVAELKAKVEEKGAVSLCRCYKSTTFPYCDGSHGSHNEDCGDNTGPLVLKKLGKPEEERGLDKVAQAEYTPTLSAGAPGRSNNYGVPSNMPPDNPVKRVDMIDIEDLEVGAASKPVAFCRCWKSTTFPFCDGSHGGHNEECGDNAGPAVVMP